MNPSGNAISAEHFRANYLARSAIIIPTYNASSYWPQLKDSLNKQGVQKCQILVVDSSSSDDTADLVQDAGYNLKRIPMTSFRHGATRQMAVESVPWADFLIFLTQDARPYTDRSLESLVQAFSNPQVGAVYGRQIARSEAGPIERHARLFNYPGQSNLRIFADRRALGIRAAFFSNSFAAYRRTAFDEVGGFPKGTIVSEDVTVAARMLVADWTIAYQANAQVVHSHSFSLKQEFSRYFDIGIHHRRERLLMQQFGGPSGEGISFVFSELSFLAKTRPSLIPSAMLRTLGKWCGYNLGLREELLSTNLKERLSAQSGFWLDERKGQNYGSNTTEVELPISESQHR